MTELFYIITIIIALFFCTTHFFDNNKICGKVYFRFIIFAELVVIIIAFLGLLKLWNGGGITFFASFTAVAGVITIVVLKFNLMVKRWIKSLSKLAIIIFLIEAVIFNFNSFHLFFNDYKQNELEINSAKISSVLSDVNGNESEIIIEFENIGYPIGTLKVDAYSTEFNNVLINVDIKDDTNKMHYRSGIAHILINDNNARSKIIPCHFSGNVHSLRLRINVADGDEIKINRIDINSPIEWRFSSIRYFSLLAIVLFIKVMTSKALLSKTMESNLLLSTNILRGITVGFVIIAVVLSLTYRFEFDQSFIDDFKQDTGNQITQEIVDAFVNGQVNLIAEPSQEILQLDNPYDSSQREGEYFLWDHVLYEGKYYSYYGIAPVLVLFLPYHLLTGYYFPSVWAVLLFGILGIVFLSKFYILFIKRFFPKSPLPPVIVGLLAMQMISGIWFCFNVPNFYEIAQSSGFVCITAGAYFLLSSNIIGDGEIKLIRLAASTTLLSSAVLCRPTLAVYCVTSLLFIWIGFKRIKSKKHALNKTINYVKYFTSALAPFIIIGSVQMIYNYLRFGSILEFGIKYSMTINDFTHAQYHHHFAGIGFFNYLFSFPTFIPSFPFFTSYVQTFSPNGYYFVATGTAIGMLWKFLPVSAYAYGVKAYKYSQNSNKKIYTTLIIANCIIAPFVIVFSIWESGYGARYIVDFGWQFLLGSMIIILTLWNKLDEQGQLIINRILILSVVICFILCFSQIFNWVYSNASYDALMNMMNNFARVFEFWK